MRWLLVGVVALLGYLLWWPVEIEPVAWEAPKDLGYVGVFAPNARLAHLERIEFPDALGGSAQVGPEDLAIDSDGRVYFGMLNGDILRLELNRDLTRVVNTGGRPLGLSVDHKDRLWIADAYLGLLRWSEAEGLQSVVTEVDGMAIDYADDVDVTRTGLVVFSDASSKFPARQYGTYEASLLDIMEHGGHGRLLAFRPETGETSTLLAGLNFANGVAVSHDQQWALVNETGSYRVLKVGIAEDNFGDVQVVIENLPGFPDNIITDYVGQQFGDDLAIYWVGLVSPRSRTLDWLAPYPKLRKIAQRLPVFMRPQAQDYGHIIGITLAGEVVFNLQDPDGGYTHTTGAKLSTHGLIVTSLHESSIGILPLRKLLN